MNSACEPYELTVWVSILNPGNKQVQISWSVESSDSALTQSSPFFVSHGSIYNQEHCFDETLCHRFTLNDNSITFPFQNEEDNIKSIIVSINGLTALEITEQTLTSVEFQIWSMWKYLQEWCLSKPWYYQEWTRKISKSFPSTIFKITLYLWSWTNDLFFGLTQLLGW